MLLSKVSIQSLLASILLLHAVSGYTSKPSTCGKDMVGADNKVVLQANTVCCAASEVCAYRNGVRPTSISSRAGIKCHTPGQHLSRSYQASETKTCVPYEGEAVGGIKEEQITKGSDSSHNDNSDLHAKADGSHNAYEKESHGQSIQKRRFFWFLPFPWP